MKLFSPPKRLMLAMALVSSLSFGVTVQAAGLKQTQQQILLLIQQGDYDGAIALADAFEQGHPNHAARVNFVRGLVAKAQGHNAAAAGAFRKVLAQQPDLVPARQQLAHVLFLSEDFEAARHHFDILQSTTTDPRLRQLYSSYSRAIDAQRPWTLSGYLTLAPSTNVNKGSGKENATLFGNSGWSIPKNQQGKSGLGVAAGTHGSYAVKMDDGLALVFAGGADGRFYRDRDDHVLRLNASLKPQYQNETYKVSLGPYVAQSFAGYDRSLLQYGIDADLSVKLDEGLLFSGSAAALLQNYEKDARDGYRLSLDTSLTKSLSATTMVSVMGGVVLEDADRVDYDHRDWDVGLAAGHEWGGGIISRAEVKLGQSIYDGVLAGKTENRKDWNYGAGVQLSNRNFSAMGFMPVLNYNFTRQKSNDEFSDFTSHDVAITITRNF